MKRVKSILNPSLDIFWNCSLCTIPALNLANQVVNEVRSFFGDEVFETLIPRTVKLSEAPSYGQSILEYTLTIREPCPQRSCQRGDCSWLSKKWLGAWPQCLV